MPSKNVIISLLPLLLQSGAWLLVNYNWGKKSSVPEKKAFLGFSKGEP